MARSRGHFWSKPWPAASMVWAAVLTKLLATFLVAFGFGLVTPISWAQIGFVWVYCFFWVFIEDWAKLAVYRHLELQGDYQQQFLHRLHERLHPGA